MPAKRGRDDVVTDRRGPFHPRLLFKAAANMGGLKGLLSEAVRNSLFHGRANAVYIEIRTGVRRATELVVLDDGIGMSEDARMCFGGQLGYTTAAGTGSGGRLAAATLCQVLEVVTVPKRDPEAAYQNVLHLPAFIVGVVNGTWTPQWSKVARAETPFPTNLTTGTMLIFRDFRASDADEPFSEQRMRDTSRQIRVEEIRRIIPIVLPPDLARKVVVDGASIRSPEIEGFPLWAMKPEKVGILGVVSGDIRFSNEREGRWCTIGGTTSTVPVQHFVEDCRMHNAALAARIPAELSDRRNAGFLHFEVLERFPTQGREHLDPAFFGTEEAAAVIGFLETEVAPLMRTRRAEYESRPATEETHASLQRIAARIHHAHGVQPGAIPGGGVDPSRPEDVPLTVNRVTIKLEVTRGRAEPDTGQFRVLNPLPGETFTWNDFSADVLAEIRGDRVTVRAPRRASVYSVQVRSDQHEGRTRMLNVDVREPAAEPSDAFSLIPMSTRVCVGDEKRIAVRAQGVSSGEYLWSATTTRGGSGRPVTCFTEHPGGMAVTFAPTEVGDYVVTCTDREHPEVRATCTIEVLTQPKANPGTPDAGGGAEPGNGGTRPSPVSRQDSVPLVYGGTTFTLKGVPFVDRPWSLEVDNKLIFVSDTHPANRDARTPEERDRHLSWCVASAVSAYCIRTGELAADDVEGMSRIHDDILRSAFTGTDIVPVKVESADARPARKSSAPARA